MYAWEIVAHVEEIVEMYRSMLNMMELYDDPVLPASVEQYDYIKHVEVLCISL